MKVDLPFALKDGAGDIWKPVSLNASVLVFNEDHGYIWVGLPTLKQLEPVSSPPRIAP